MHDRLGLRRSWIIGMKLVSVTDMARADIALAELVGARRAQPVLPERIHAARARLLPGLRIHRPGPVRASRTILCTVAGLGLALCIW